MADLEVGQWRRSRPRISTVTTWLPNGNSASTSRRVMAVPGAMPHIKSGRGKVIGMQGIFWDITARKLRERLSPLSGSPQLFRME